MPEAYVLINCDLGSEESVIRQINQIDGVKEVRRIEGVYDIVVRVETVSNEALKEMVTWKIRRLPEVRSTVVLIVNEKRG
jgi:DNA-binding Lrp family transcriptional regulator